MKLALVAPLVAPLREPHLGGAQTLIADLAGGLSVRGWEVDVFAASGSQLDGARVVDSGVDAVELRESLFRAGGQRGHAASQAAFERVYAMVAAGSYEAVHNHAFDPPAITLGGSLRAPVIHTLHLPPEAAVVEAVREALRHEPRPVLAGVSQSHAALWREVLPLDLVLPCGVPVGRMPWSASPGRDALFAGRLTPEKGVFEAVEIALAAGMAITIVGSDYDPAYSESLRERWGGDARVRMEFAIPRAQLWEKMRAAAAVLCPVRWDEPFGLVAAEAQASGTPVIGFRRGGLVEVVDSGVTGELVPEGDIAAAVRALVGVHAFRRPDCRRHAEQHFDLEASLDAHEALYRAVAAGRPAHRQAGVRG